MATSMVTREAPAARSAQGIVRYKCANCKHEYEEILDSLGHDYTWTYDDFSHSAVCANCDYTPQGLHDYEDACVCECGRISTERRIFDKNDYKWQREERG